MIRRSRGLLNMALLLTLAAGIAHPALARTTHGNTHAHGLHHRTASYGAHHRTRGTHLGSNGHRRFGASHHQRPASLG